MPDFVLKCFEKNRRSSQRGRRRLSRDLLSPELGHLTSRPRRFRESELSESSQAAVVSPFGLLIPPAIQSCPTVRRVGLTAIRLTRLPSMSDKLHRPQTATRAEMASGKVQRVLACVLCQQRKVKCGRSNTAPFAFLRDFVAARLGHLFARWDLWPTDKSRSGLSLRRLRKS